MIAKLSPRRVKSRAHFIPQPRGRTVLIMRQRVILFPATHTPFRSPNMLYENIVIGAGIEGSSAAYYLVKTGLKSVLMLEQVFCIDCTC